MIREIKSYRDLKVWQKAMDLVIVCYEMTKHFPRNEQFGLSSQIQRAAVSVPANIAEGYGRSYTREYLRHLSIAKGSLAELNTHLEIAGRLSYCKTELVTNISNLSDEIGRMLSGLQKSLTPNP